MVAVGPLLAPGPDWPELTEGGTSTAEKTIVRSNFMEAHKIAQDLAVCLQQVEGSPAQDLPFLSPSLPFVSAPAAN